MRPITNSRYAIFKEPEGFPLKKQRLLPGGQSELNNAGEDGVLEVRRSAQSFGLNPDFAEQPLQVFGFAHAEASHRLL